MHSIGIPLNETETNKFMQRFLEFGETHIGFKDFFTKVHSQPYRRSFMTLMKKSMMPTTDPV